MYNITLNDVKVRMKKIDLMIDVSQPINVKPNLSLDSFCNFELDSLFFVSSIFFLKQKILFIN